MKKLIAVLALLIAITLVVGCSSNSNGENQQNLEKNGAGEDYAMYIGDWRLKVQGDEELYLLTFLEEYLGATGIKITEINEAEVKGSIFSVQGAPGHRQAEVSFSGKLENGKMIAAYEDEAWKYTGKVELTFENNTIAAAITRDEVEPAPMWGIPEGDFTFVKPIKTEKVELTKQEKEGLENFLRPTIKDAIEPFAEGSLTDESIIKFIGCSLAVGFIDAGEFGDRVEHGVDVVFDGSVMNDLARKYFGVEVKDHKTMEIVTYENGKYSVPAMGGVTEYPQIQLLLRDKENKGVHYALVDYLFEGPEQAAELEYQYLIKLQKTDGYTIKAIKEVEDPINMELPFNSLSENAIKEDLMARNDLIPFEPVVGGTMGFYSKEDIHLLEDNKVLAYFEDGHIGGKMTLKYEINDGHIEWTVLEAELD
ncbi:MAG: hypothetical protein ACOX2P_02430 [Bacillota bacterium]